eukprot:Colp12_sorted_trinity150504_noHs@22843
MSNKIKSVAVIGAGIGGLTFARTLKCLKPDLKVTVFESKGSINHDIDRGIGLWNNAQTILKNLSLQTYMSNEAKLIRPAAYRNVNGVWLSQSSFTDANAGRVATVTENGLLSALSSDVDVVLSKRVSHVSHEDEKIRTHFADGSHEETDLVVAADGIHSVARSYLPERQILPLGHITFSYVDTTHSALSDFQPFETLHDGCKFAAVPLKNGHFWFYTTWKDFSTADAFDKRVELSEIMRHVHRWHDPIPQFLLGCDPEKLLIRDLHIEHGRVKTMTKGRVALVGDAAHAIPSHLAQGSAVAIEDGYELAHALAHTHTYQDAFRLYNKIRLPRVNRCLTVTRFTHLLAEPANPLSEVMRDGVMRVVPRRVNAWVFDKFLEHSLGEGVYRPAPMKP